MKRNLINELTEGIDALAERRKMERDRLDERLGKRRERVNQEELFAPHMEEANDRLTQDKKAILALIKESDEIAQILGKALCYPYYKDDPKNFPTATEADGVCVGDHTAWSLAKDAADLIAKLRKRHPTQEEALAQYHWLKANSKRNETRTIQE